MATGKTLHRPKPEKVNRTVWFEKCAAERGGRDRLIFFVKYFYSGQAARLISTGPLNTLLCLHARPIKVVVYNQPSDPFGWENLS